MIVSIGTDGVGVHYHSLVFGDGAFPALPWGSETFDCIVFPPSDGSRAVMAALVDCLPYAQLDWVHIAGPDTEHWHDEVDRASVRKGVQRQVGDGRPMTAWFEDVRSLSDWESSYNHGGCDNFLFIFTDSAVPIDERVALIKRKTGAQTSPCT